MEALFILVAIAALISVPAGIAAFVLVLNQRTQLRLLQAKLKKVSAMVGQGQPDTASGFSYAEQTQPEATQESSQTVRPAEVARNEEPEIDDKTTAPERTDEPFVVESAVPDADDNANGEDPAYEPDDNPKQSPVIGTESAIGGKLSIWIGGLALALGGLFMVRYVIENAFLGPTARVTLGFLFGAAVAALGEWTRRRPQKFELKGFEQANIPAMLTAVGIFITFAAVYAAHNLYDLIGPVPAFILLSVLALAVMVLALLHGPTLAALGLVASYSVPFLINTSSTSITVLAAYVVAVSAASCGVARMRGWLWLAYTSVGAIVAFGMLFALQWNRQQYGVVDLYLLASYALCWATFVFGFYVPVWQAADGVASKRDDQTIPDHDPAPDSQDAGDQTESTSDHRTTDELAVDVPGTLALSLVLSPIVLTFSWNKPVGLEIMELVALMFGPLLIAYAYPAMRYVCVLPVVLACLRYLLLDVPAVDVPMDMLNKPGLYAAELAQSVTRFWLVGALVAICLLGVAYASALRSMSRVVLVSTSTTAAVALYLIAYGRIEQFASSGTFATIGFVMALVMHTIATMIMARLDKDRDGRDLSVSTLLIGSLVMGAFAIGVWLDGPALTMGLGLLPLATAVVYWRYDLAPLRPACVVAVLPYVLRLLWDPFINANALAGEPIFLNGLLWGYGVPATGLIGVAYLLTKRNDDIWAQAMQAAAVALGVAALSMLTLHMIDKTFAFTGRADQLAGAATLVLIGGGVSLGLSRLNRSSLYTMLGNAADILSILGIVLGAWALLFSLNPMFPGFGRSSNLVGEGLFLNLIGYAYFLPLLLYALIVQQGWGVRKHETMIASTAFVAALGFFWINLTIRQFFSPNDLLAVAPSELEIYTYSVVWLIISLACLGYGIQRHSLIWRKASGVIMLAVVLKVFFYDLQGLTGIWRAVSFMGLGAVLLSVGYVYQRALRTKA